MLAPACARTAGPEKRAAGSASTRIVMVHDATTLGPVEPAGGERGVGVALATRISPPPAAIWTRCDDRPALRDARILLARFADPLSITRRGLPGRSLPRANRERPARAGRPAGHLRVPDGTSRSCQVGKFERQHDPLGVINAYRFVKKPTTCASCWRRLPRGQGTSSPTLQKEAGEDPDTA